MKLTPTTTLLELFYHWEGTAPDKVFLRQPLNGSWRDFTWREVGQHARAMAAYLESLALPPRCHVAILSKNCAEWVITDLAIMLAGHVSVPFYPTLTASQLHLVMAHSGSRVLFVGKLDDWAGMKPGIPEGVRCISFPNYNPDPAHEQWSNILAKHNPKADSPVPSSSDLLTVIYTSGTTGNPKGVMLTFGNFSALLYHSQEHLRLDIPDIRVMSYLPLCHIAERGVLLSVALAGPASIYFSESLEKFAKNLVECAPTHFGGVPRIWMKFQQGILAKLPQRRLDLLLWVPFVKNIVRSKIKRALGLHRAEVFLVAAAPIPVSLLEWFAKLGIQLQEAYGMTETTAIATFTPRSAIRFGKVGKVVGGTVLKIEPDTGEICLKSPQNMVGYYNEPALTAATIDPDGWLHTGDCGEMDADGYLHITGRVKEMYKTSKGEYVAPAQIEMDFAGNAYIEQICVVGQSIPQPIGLVVLSDIGRSENPTTVGNSLRQAMEAVNPTLKPYERVKKMVVLREPWTVENGMMTPTLKIRRSEIERAFEHRLEEWYGAAAEVVWE